MATGNPTASVKRHSMPPPKALGPKQQSRYVAPDPDLPIHSANREDKSISVHGYLSGGLLLK